MSFRIFDFGYTSVCVSFFFFWRRKDAAQALRADLERLAKLRRKMYLV